MNPTPTSRIIPIHATPVPLIHRDSYHRGSLISSFGPWVRVGVPDPCRDIGSSCGPFTIPSTAPPVRAQNVPPSPWLSIGVSLMLLAGLAGCGSASTDNAQTLESRTGPRAPAARSTGQGEKAWIPPLPPDSRPGFMSGTGATAAVGGNLSQGDKLTLKPEGMPHVEPDGRETLSVPDIPESIAKGLESTDARERLQAMNHWEVPGTKVPLDPLFEAVDDEDEVVRAKATEIIERYWAAEQEAKGK